MNRMESLLLFIYLIASITFILGLKMLSNPKTARKGNTVAALGMGIAIIGTILLHTNDAGDHLGNHLWIIGGLAIGGVIGTLSAKNVKMTAMPQMVSLFNGMGGACAALISIIEFKHLVHDFKPELYAGGGYTYFSTLDGGTLLVILAGLIIGSVSFTGSMIAWAKLDGRLNDYAFNGQQYSEYSHVDYYTRFDMHDLILASRRNNHIFLCHTCNFSHIWNTLRTSNRRRRYARRDFATQFLHRNCCCMWWFSL